MSSSVTVVDYGLGNINAFCNMFSRQNISCDVASTPAQLCNASRLVLPGVGSFDWAIGKLNTSGLRPILDDLVLNLHRPVLGVCVGLQMMAISSHEGQSSGLSWINAEILKLPEPTRTQETLTSGYLPLPHMGWNEVTPNHPHPLFSNLDRPNFYFLHSYYLRPLVPDLSLACSTYGKTFTCAVAYKNIMGVQFHPEKSHQSGATLLRNFSAI